MKIFISWSGKRSKAVAKALNDWLPKVIQALKPFYSDEIEKGTKGIEEVNSTLEGTKFGIICLNAENLDSKWIHYEAGALSKTEGARVWTLLHGLNSSDVAQPLAQFQHTLTSKEDIFRLLDSINKNLPEPLDTKILNDSFERWWSDLEDELKKAEQLSDKKQATDNKESKNIRTDRQVLDEILDLLRNQQRKSVEGFNETAVTPVETFISTLKKHLAEDEAYKYASFELPIHKLAAERTIESIEKSIIKTFGDATVITSEVDNGYRFEVKLSTPVTYTKLTEEIKFLAAAYGYVATNLSVTPRKLKASRT